MRDDLKLVPRENRCSVVRGGGWRGLLMFGARPRPAAPFEDKTESRPFGTSYPFMMKRKGSVMDMDGKRGGQLSQLTGSIGRLTDQFAGEFVAFTPDDFG
jgi:hypothetical protein